MPNNIDRTVNSILNSCADDDGIVNADKLDVYIELYSERVAKARARGRVEDANRLTTITAMLIEHLMESAV